MIIWEIFAFVFGVLWGSFLNAVIYRLPREISVVRPRSQCTSCKTPIKWYQNIPVLSYLFLGGKCASCSKRISFRYPTIELFVGLGAWFFLPQSFNSITLSLYTFKFAVFCIFVCHFFIDIDHQILPDSLNVYLFILFLIYAVIYFPWQHYVFGGLAGFLFPLGITWLFYKLKGQIGLGGGDIKLYGALGVYFGPIGIFHNIFLSCFLGSIFGVFFILLKKMDKSQPMAFGPFILITAAFQIFFPEHFNQLSGILFSLGRS